MEFEDKWGKLVIFRFLLVFGTAIFLWIGNFISDHFFYQEKTIFLKDKWDDAVSWDFGKKSQRGYSNPSSNPWSEILIGDSSYYYRMPNTRAYFRFDLDLPAGSRIISAKMVFHCSAGGQDKPKLKIHYIDAKDFSFENRPWRLPRSASAVDWIKQEQDWNWVTHQQYQTPELRDLVQDYFRKHGGGSLGIVIMNMYGNRHQFKGICSFDDERERSARLVIRYK